MVGKHLLNNPNLNQDLHFNTSMLSISIVCKRSAVLFFSGPQHHNTNITVTLFLWSYLQCSINQYMVWLLKQLKIYNLKYCIFSTNNSMLVNILHQHALKKTTYVPSINDVIVWERKRILNIHTKLIRMDSNMIFIFMLFDSKL
jgi:hypothetical protein